MCGATAIQTQRTESLTPSPDKLNIHNLLHPCKKWAVQLKPVCNRSTPGHRAQTKSTSKLWSLLVLSSRKRKTSSASKYTQYLPNIREKRKWCEKAKKNYYCVHLFFGSGAKNVNILKVSKKLTKYIQICFFHYKNEWRIHFDTAENRHLEGWITDPAFSCAQ